MAYSFSVGPVLAMELELAITDAAAPALEEAQLDELDPEGRLQATIEQIEAARMAAVLLAEQVGSHADDRFNVQIFGHAHPYHVPVDEEPDEALAVVVACVPYREETEPTARGPEDEE